MPSKHPHHALTAAVLLGLSSTTSASTQHAAPSEPALHQPSTQLLAIDDAVEATKEDPTALCFVVVLPEDYQQARAIRDLWTKAKKSFDHNDHQVFFVRGQDAQTILDTAFINAAPAAIAYRDGRPYHSRTGTLTQDNLSAFLALSFDNSAPTTAAPSQTAYLYNTMNELAQADQDAPAAQGACQIMLNLHALIHGPYASTFSPEDLTAMTTLYNQTQLTLATLDLSDPAVLKPIERTSAMAMKTWNTRTNSTFGIGIWMDLAQATGNNNDILDWIDQGLDNPATTKRVAQSLADYGSSIASLLIKSHRYEALACTITSPTQIENQLAYEAKLAEQIAQLETKDSDFYQRHLASATNEAAAYHAALLLTGRTIEAWQVAQLTQDFAGPQLASAALCTAALNAGTLSDRHASLIGNLDQQQHAKLIRSLNTSFAIVPTDD